MKRLGCSLLLALAIAVSVPTASADVHRVRHGMTMDDVREVLGPPRRIGRQVILRRYLEQWYYDKDGPVWIDFDCIRGKEPSVINVRTLEPK